MQAMKTEYGGLGECIVLRTKGLIDWAYTPPIMQHAQCWRPCYRGRRDDIWFSQHKHAVPPQVLYAHRLGHSHWGGESIVVCDTVAIHMAPVGRMLRSPTDIVGAYVPPLSSGCWVWPVCNRGVSLAALPTPPSMYSWCRRLWRSLWASITN